MINSVLGFFQRRLNFVWENSFILRNIDWLIFPLILLVFVLSIFAPSDYIGYAALSVLFLTVLKIMTKPNFKLDCNLFEIFLVAYFMFVVVSVAGSTLFMASLKGFLKTFTYMGFYFSLVQFLKENKDKRFPIFATIAGCVAFESIVGIMQNFSHVAEISGWQDVSRLNPEEVMTRVYGTLKPYNPNLFGGYLVSGVPALFCVCAYEFFNRKYKFALISLAFALLSVVTLLQTGCRGAYIGLLTIFIGIFALSAKFLWNNFKKWYLSFVGLMVLFSSFAIVVLKPLRARIFSIFAMRGDSSTSFRFNVYQSALQMFKDNWLLGIGVGNQNFREIYGLYMKTGFDALSAYNIYLEIGIESGIFALASFVSFLGVLIAKTIRFVQDSVDSKNIVLVAFALISICAVCVHGFVDTVYFRPQLQFIFWAMVAIIRVSVFENEK